MKILYLSCHEVLEYDELSMLSEIGIDLFSTGAYRTPLAPAGETLRPPLPNLHVDPDDDAEYCRLLKSNNDVRDCLCPGFLRRFDAVIVMHRPEWVRACIDAGAGIPVIWRTIGQSHPAMEREIASLKSDHLRIVRYSPREQQLHDYCGHQAIIRFGKPVSEFAPWVGNIRRVVTFSNRMRQRGTHTCYDIFRAIIAPFDCDIYGVCNGDIHDLSRGSVTYCEQLRILNRYRVLGYTGTCPASYTLSFMEAWLAGIPIVAVGRQLWNLATGSGELYEVPDLIVNGFNGFVSDSIEELQSAVLLMLNDDEAASCISMRGRESAQRVFDAARITQQWKSFLVSL
jgi:glycosyltransferase involved in cell wall biosynthesis